jgi:hypothetical protein
VIVSGFAPEVPVLANRRFAGGLPAWLLGYYVLPADARIIERHLAREEVGAVVLLEGPRVFVASWPGVARKLIDGGFKEYAFPTDAPVIHLWLRPPADEAPPDAATGLPCRPSVYTGVRRGQNDTRSGAGRGIRRSGSTRVSRGPLDMMDFPAGDSATFEVTMLGRFGAALGHLRPRAVARTQRAVDNLTGEMQEARRTLKQLADASGTLQTSTGDVLARLDSMSGSIRTLQEQVNTLVRRESQLRAVIRADVALDDALAGLPAVCDEKKIEAHFRAAVDRAELHLDPFPHVVVRDLFPNAFYDALVRGIPPVELFGDKPFNKQQLKVPFTMAPAYGRRVWTFFVHRAAPRIMQPVLVDKFREPLREWIAANWPSLARDPFGPPMDFNTGDGRILLRGRGYHIRPHRDPKWGFLTCILYLAREHDSESWGTQLFAVDDDIPARGAKPHWIEPAQCRLVAEVPFRRNSMLVFLNSTGAHGANIPEDAEPADLQRYIYQCRIGPSAGATRALMAELSDDAVAFWAGKVSEY